MDIVNEIDLQIKLTLETLTNSHLDDETWYLASFPRNSYVDFWYVAFLEMTLWMLD